MNKLICLILITLACGCATTPVPQDATNQRLTALEQKVCNLDHREKQLAKIVNEMLVGQMRGTSFKVSPKVESSDFGACLAACRSKHDASSTDMDQSFADACKDIPECKKFMTDEDERQQVVP